MTAQFRGRNHAGEWLVTVFPAEGTKPASAEAAFRPNEWDYVVGAGAARGSACAGGRPVSAQELRDAAALMRKRAQAARAGRWAADGDEVAAHWSLGDVEVAVCRGSIDEGNEANAEHIASWHPAVALAVADWLEATAAENDSSDALAFLNFAGADAQAALTVARAYLGSAS
jgi:hypothetical protein